MRILLALDGDDAGLRATASHQRRIADWSFSWAIPRGVGPTAQALAHAQQAYDNAQLRYLIMGSAEAHDELELVADYLIDLFEEFSHGVDREFVTAQTPDELSLLLDPPVHRQVEDVLRIDYVGIKQRNHIEELVRQDIGGETLRMAGTRKWKCRCPLPGHDEKTPSFWLYEESNSFYCFGCQAGGDVIDYLKAMNRNLKDY